MLENSVKIRKMIQNPKLTAVEFVLLSFGIPIYILPAVVASVYVQYMNLLLVVVRYLDSLYVQVVLYLGIW